AVIAFNPESFLTKETRFICHHGIVKSITSARFLETVNPVARISILPASSAGISDGNDIDLNSTSKPCCSAMARTASGAIPLNSPSLTEAHDGNDGSIPTTYVCAKVTTENDVKTRNRMNLLQVCALYIIAPPP